MVLNPYPHNPEGNQQNGHGQHPAHDAILARQRREMKKAQENQLRLENEQLKHEVEELKREIQRRDNSRGDGGGGPGAGAGGSSANVA